MWINWLHRYFNIKVETHTFLQFYTISLHILQIWHKTSFFTSFVVSEKKCPVDFLPFTPKFATNGFDEGAKTIDTDRDLRKRTVKEGKTTSRKWQRYHLNITCWLFKPTIDKLIPKWANRPNQQLKSSTSPQMSWLDWSAPG